MKKWIDIEFDIGTSVYLKTDKEQLERMVYAIQLVKGSILYGLTNGPQTSWHYDFEISSEINILIKQSL